MNDKPHSAMLADLLVEMAERMERGESLDLESFEKDLGALEEMLPTVEHLLALGRDVSSSIYRDSVYDALVDDHFQLPNHRLDDFRLIREVGRGGMGVVYEAEQVSLNRRVAVKLLPVHTAVDKRQRRRFYLEAQAAASLRHPHIVPVYSVGMNQGLHYYAMQFIDGCSLAGLIAGLRHNRISDYLDVTPGMTGLTSSEFDGDDKNTLQAPPGQIEIPPKFSFEYFQLMASFGQQAAEALEYAHQQRIVHRDIKPGNLLLDTTGWVWVTDFGLAQSPRDENLTETGDIVGTLRYMSPEQALGQRGVVDQRTDIYSLGVTLYELVTLEPAFSGERGAVLKQIETAHPSALRRNRRIPKDLSTIIEKAMEKDPQDRYQTALELSEDLRRFQAGEPILASPVGVWEQLRRWCYRHRSALLLMTLIAGFVAIVSLTGWIVTQNALEQEMKAKYLAKRREVETHAAVQSIFLKILSENRIHDPQFDELQTFYAEKAEMYLERFLRENRNDHFFEKHIACALAQMGIIRQRQGRLDEAIAFYRQSFGQYVRLVGVSAEPERTGYRDHASEVNGLWVRCLVGKGCPDEAKKVAERGRKINPRSWKPKNILARLIAATPDVTNSELQAGLELLEEPIRMEPEGWQLRNTLGMLLLRLGDDKKAIAALRAARRSSSCDLMMNRYLLAITFMKAGFNVKAETAFQPLEKHHAKILRQNPDLKMWQEEVGLLLR
ncbi:MAG: protein kinase [Gemmataceae bacterium]